MSAYTVTPSRCHIDLAALRRNFSRLGDPASIMPVIKSDAYGHGLLPVARALGQAGARRFAVGTVRPCARPGWARASCRCWGPSARKTGRPPWPWT